MKTGAASIVLAVALAGQAFAQGAGQSGVTPAQTGKVVTALSDMFRACSEIETAYRPDCLSRALQRGASKISNNPGYWEAHVALTRASRAMTRLVRQNADPDASRIRVAGYRLTAVAEAALPNLRRAGEDVMARAEQDLGMLPSYERAAFEPIISLLRNDRPWP